MVGEQSAGDLVVAALMSARAGAVVTLDSRRSGGLPSQLTPTAAAARVLAPSAPMGRAMRARRTERPPRRSRRASREAARRRTAVGQGSTPAVCSTPTPARGVGASASARTSGAGLRTDSDGTTPGPLGNSSTVADAEGTESPASGKEAAAGPNASESSAAGASRVALPADGDTTTPVSDAGASASAVFFRAAVHADGSVAASGYDAGGHPSARGSSAVLPSDGSESCRGNDACDSAAATGPRADFPDCGDASGDGFSDSAGIDEEGCAPSTNGDDCLRASTAGSGSEPDMSVQENLQGERDDESSGSASSHRSEPADWLSGVDAFILPEDLMSAPPDEADQPEDAPVAEPSLVRESPAGGHPSMLPLPMPFKCVEHLYAYLLLRGQCHGTEELYEVVRAGINITSPVALPQANTIRYNISPVVNSTWMLPLRTCSIRRSLSAGVVNVRYIAPSDHVRRDLQFVSTLELFKKADRRTDKDRELHPEFIDSPLFQHRSSVLMSGQLVPHFVLNGVQLSVGDCVGASLTGGRSLDGIVIRRAFFAAAQSGLARNQTAHAGDFIVECDSVELQVGGYFVSRHWCAASMPPMTWHALDDTVVEVLELRRDGPGDLSPHGTSGSAAAGAAPRRSDHSPRRLMWDQIDGEASLVVSLCFYSDDFGTQSGKEVTMGGVYMSYLSWLFQDRRSSHAARTVAVTPASVDSDCILEAITDDLRTGAREGWLCRCAGGTMVRVRADVCFFVGDYLQVAKTSKLMGSAANSPCTLCAYRLHGAPGCRFGLAGSSMSTELMRTTARTTSVCVAASAWVDADDDE